MVLRQRFWIDSNVQGVLIGRFVIYWAVGVLYLALGNLGFQYNQNPEYSFERHFAELFGQVWPWIPSLILFLPLVLFDVIRLSNLFVGPIYRLRNHLTKLMNEPDCHPLTFREDDYWQDLAEPVNMLQLKIMQMQLKIAQYEDQLTSQDNAKAAEPSSESAQPSAPLQISPEDLAALQEMSKAVR